MFSGRTGNLLYRLVSPHPVPGGFFGICAGIGDVDGDGKGDLAVGAPGEAGVYVFSGGDGHYLYTLHSPNSGAGFGSVVTALPDMDRDGVPDIGVGATGERNEGGRAYVFSGATGNVLLRLEPLNPDSYGYFGSSIAGIPDLDGDGVPDIIVGKPYESYSDAAFDRGRAYLFSGATGMLIATIDAPAHPAGYFGSYVLGLPDIDGDGRGDFIVSADQQYPGPPNAGRVLIYSGATRSLLHSLHSPHVETGGFGIGLYLGPDLDADGFPEFATSGNEVVNGQVSAGRGYIFSARDGRLVHEFESPYPQVSGHFGAPVAFLRRAGPGPAAIAISAIGDQDNAPPLTGRVYIFESCPSDFDYNGTANSADFFAFLTAFFTDAPSGDFNHDGSINSQDFFDFIAAFFAGC